MQRRVVSLGGACGLSVPPLVVLKTQVDGFFRYEANGMGGETQKCDLRVRLAVVQILEKQGLGGLFGANFWYFWTSLGFEILGSCGKLIYSGGA